LNRHIRIPAWFYRLLVQATDAARDLLPLISVEKEKSNIAKLEKKCRTISDYFDLITQSVRTPILNSSLSPSQRKYEILTLLQDASPHGLSSVAEIGTSLGGTFYLFCKAAKANATIITIDLKIPLWRRKLIKSYAKLGQTPIIIRGDSHARDTVRLVEQALGKNKLDLLFIDGDHSYEGIQQDFLDYAPFVKSGGWIAFHDVVPDYWTRYKIHTTAWTGGVPRFWAEVKHTYKHFEIIEDPNQDGCGIGVLVWE